MIAESEKAALAAIERFEAAARRSLISAEHRVLKAIGASVPVILSKLARRFDLSVFMQSEPNGVDNDDMIETSLFQSGRPLIVVPYIQKEGLKLDHVVCCWDGSRAAARAVNDGLPLLVKATTVDLLIVVNEKTNTAPNEIRGADMAKHLARHDVKVQIVTISAADFDVTKAILSYVADISGTLIVMGGYGHPKLREVILGGRDPRYAEVDDRSGVHGALTRRSRQEPAPCGPICTPLLPPPASLVRRFTPLLSSSLPGLSSLALR